MNFRNIALSELASLASETEKFNELNLEGIPIEKSFTVGQVILAVIKRKPEGKTVEEWLLSVSDEDLYSKIETAKLKERP